MSPASTPSCCRWGNLSPPPSPPPPPLRQHEQAEEPRHTEDLVTHLDGLRLRPVLLPADYPEHPPQSATVPATSAGQQRKTCARSWRQTPCHAQQKKLTSIARYKSHHPTTTLRLKAGYTRLQTLDVQLNSRDELKQLCFATYVVTTMKSPQKG